MDDKKPFILISPKKRKIQKNDDNQDVHIERLLSSVSDHEMTSGSQIKKYMNVPPLKSEPYKTNFWDKRDKRDKRDKKENQEKEEKRSKRKEEKKKEKKKEIIKIGYEPIARSDENFWLKRQVQSGVQSGTEVDPKIENKENLVMEEQKKDLNEIKIEKSEIRSGEIKKILKKKKILPKDDTPDLFTISFPNGVLIPDQKKTRLIILDINGLLCWKFFSEKYPQEQVIKMAKDLKMEYIILEKFVVFIRPKVRIFLDFCYEYADVGFFSSTTHLNGYSILDKILTEDQRKKTKFFWYREHVKLDPEFGIKPEIKQHDTVKILTDVLASAQINHHRLYSYYNTVMLDDDLNKIRFNSMQNSHLVKSFNLDEIINSYLDHVDQLMNDKCVIGVSKQNHFKDDNVLFNSITDIQLKFVKLSELENLTTPNK